jgi:RNA polymerase sigma-70 factor, ECF subfamily
LVSEGGGGREVTIETRDHRRPVEREYARIVERHRDELHAHSRRILRSSQDAEDALQEALLRAWRALPSFEGRSSLRGWLYRIVTNTSLDEIKRRPQRVVPVDLEETVAGSETDPEDRYERRESIRHAVAAAERLLPEKQRAVLVLREVLGSSVPAVNSALQRARATIDRTAGEGASADRPAGERAA